MKICIIAEGSYPYTIGGVSGWLQMIISSMPEHQFIIYTIGAQEKDRGRFRYELPPNVVKVEEIFLDLFLQEEGKWGKRFHMGPREKEALKCLLLGQSLHWEDIFSYFRGGDVKNISDFLMSRSFFDLLQDVYKERYSQVSFNDLFWTIRSMIVPLLHLIRQQIPEADLYHSVSTGYAGVLGSLGKFLYNKPFILTEHGIYTREREEEIIKSQWVKVYFKDTWIEYFYGLSKCAYSSAEKVITLFKRNKEIEIELGCDGKKIHIIPNGIEVENFKNVKMKAEDETFINIGAVVRVVPIKDIKTMIEGFGVAKEKFPKIKLFIMGPVDEDDEYYGECTEFVEGLGLRDVIFTGNLDVASVLGTMDMLLLTSISEGQPLAVLEAMACSKPVIATDVGSCRELLYGNGDGYGSAGIVVPVMDYEKIGHAIVRLCKDDQLRRSMGISGCRRVANLYTKEKLITSYKNIYAEYEVV